MKFVLIKKGRVEEANLSTLELAMKAVGIEPGQVDFGIACRGLDERDGRVRFRVGVVVGQFGMYEQPTNQYYFSIGPNLYAGNAVLYGFDEAGETIDMPFTPPVMFYRDAATVERAIAEATVERPEISINDRTIWQWHGDQK